MFLSDPNGVVTTSLLLIVIFWSFSVIPPHRWTIFSDHCSTLTNLLSHRIITIDYHYFSPSTTAWFNCDHFYWYFLKVSMLPPLCWLYPLVRMADYIGITLLSNQITAMYYDCFLQSQWCRFTFNIVDFHIMRFLYHSSSQMSATTCLGCFLLRNFLSERSHYHDKSS